jgi:hypothetical protein
LLPFVSPYVSLTPGAGAFLKGRFFSLRARGPFFPYRPRLPGRPRGSLVETKVSWEVEEIDDEPLHVERVAALDIGKAGLDACIRVPSETNSKRRAQEVRRFGITKREILSLADWLRTWQAAKVVLESTGDYRKGSSAGWRPKASTANCWTPSRSRRCPAGPRRTEPTACGWPRSPSGAWSGAVPCHRRRSAAYARSPATAGTR